MIRVGSIERFCMGGNNIMVSVCIHFFNSFLLLKRCIDILRMFTEYPHELVLLNDGSTERDAIEYAKCEADVFVDHNVNLGMAQSRNDLIAASSGEYIFFLDCDVVVSPRWLGKLVSTFEKFRYNKDYRIFVLSPLFTHRIGQCARSPKWYDQERQLMSGLAPAGGAMMFERSLIDIVGWLDPELYNWGEDVDFMQRLRGFGSIDGYAVKMVTDPKVVVYHPGWIGPSGFCPEVDTQWGLENSRWDKFFATREVKVKILRGFRIMNSRWGLKHEGLERLEKELGAEVHE